MPSDPGQGGEEVDYKAEGDADTLQRHAELTADPDRHGSALKVLAQRHKATTAAMGHAKKAQKLMDQMRGDGEEADEMKEGQGENA